MLLNNIGRNGEIIRWKNNLALAADEIVGPLFEDHILLTVINLIDTRLPAYVKEHFHKKLGNDRRLMDVKTDILTNVKKYIHEIES